MLASRSDEAERGGSLVSALEPSVLEALKRYDSPTPLRSPEFAPALLAERRATMKDAFTS
jgi:hypothetical protein